MKRKRRVTALVIFVSILASVLGACGDLAPTNNLNTFLINEIYIGNGVGFQWVEILANSAGKDGDPATTMDMTGVTLKTSKGTLDLSKVKGSVNAGGKAVDIGNAKAIPAGALLVVVSNTSAFKTNFTGTAFEKVAVIDGSSVLGNLDSKDDALSLTRGTELLDQLGWGNPGQELLSKLSTSSDTNMKLSNPGGGDVPKSLGRTPPAGPRDPGKPGIFTVHETVSPGGKVPQPIEKYNFVLKDFTNVITVVGSLLLFLVFIMIGVIARRFETLAQQRTYWQLLLLAPIGLLIYSVVTIWAFVGPNGSLNESDRWWGFTSLFLTGIACVVIINVFRNIAKDILAAE
jgi:hypothetical protein